MVNLKEEEIRQIVHRATMFQKFYGSSAQQSLSKLESEYPHLFEITDSLKLDRAFVCEALLEHQGIPVEDPIFIDAGFSKAEVLGFSSGNLEPETLKELKAQIEYHFNTVGELKHRKNKTIWKATPKGLARMFASQNSPEVQLDLTGNTLKIIAKQSMKTVNKFYFPSFAAAFGSVMFFSATAFGVMNGEEAFGVIMSAIFGSLSFLYARFINGRKQKKKNRLFELVENLQQILERRQKVSHTAAPSISIPESEYDNIDEIELKSTKKVPN